MKSTYPVRQLAATRVDVFAIVSAVALLLALAGCKSSPPPSFTGRHGEDLHLTYCSVWTSDTRCKQKETAVCPTGYVYRDTNKTISEIRGKPAHLSEAFKVIECLHSHSSPVLTQKSSDGSAKDTSKYISQSFYKDINNDRVCTIIGPGLEQGFAIVQREPVAPRILDAMRASARQEATRRGLLSVEDVEAIRQKRIRPGLSRCALFAIAGLAPTYPGTPDSKALGTTGLSYDCRGAPVPFCPYTRVDVDADRVVAVAQTYHSPLE
jgi:hypothetical protein